jgi:hypothetical protein
MLRFERLKIGLVIGLGMGLAYGLTSQLINRVVLFDVPFYIKFDAPLISILITKVLGVIWGGITSLPEKKVNSLVFGTLLGSIGFTIITFLFDDQRYEFIPGLARVIVVFIPSLLAFFGLSYLLRWSEDRLMMDYFKQDRLTTQRYLPIFLALFITAILGVFSLKSAEIRSDFRLVDAYLQKAQTSKSVNELPEAVRGINGYLRHADVAYSLDTSTDVEMFTGEAPQGTSEASKGIVIVRFEDGFRLTCLTIDDSLQVLCEEFVGQ